MDHALVEKDGKTYVECLDEMGPLASDQDALDLVGLCLGYDTHRLMLHAHHLSPAFFDLKTGLAGSVMLKFSNYHIKVVAVVTPAQVGSSRFAEMAMESNHSNAFGVFYARKQAEDWLMSE